MRVLVLCEYPSLNGGERSFLEAARRIDTPDIELTVAAPSNGPLADALSRYDLEHIGFDLFDSRGVRYPRQQLREKLGKYVTDLHADLVHANSLSMSRLLGPVAQEKNVPSIGHLRDIMRLNKASIEDLNRHSGLLAVSQATRRWYVELGLDASKVKVAYNGVDVCRFRPRAASGLLHQQLAIPADALLVGSVGQIGLRKGVDLYVAAAAHIATHRQDVHFIYVGQRYSQKRESIDFEREVRAAAAQPPLRGRFHFLGVRDDVHLVLNELAVYVHAARQEPLGRVLLEAGGAATAIVATDVGGTQEIFPDSTHAARLVPPQSTPALTAAIEHVLNTPNKRQTMGRNARQRIEQVFDAEHAARELARCYREIGAQ